MKTLLLPIFALAVVATPVLAEDQDQPKHSKNRSHDAPPPQRHVNPAPQRNVNPAPRVVPPRVQQNFSANNQYQNNVRRSAPRTFTARTFNPNTQLQNRTRPQSFTPPDQDAAVANVPSRTEMPMNSQWRNRPRSRTVEPNVIAPQAPAPQVTTTQANTTVQNQDWRNRDGRNRDWRNRDRTNTTTTSRNWQTNNNNGTWDQARRHHHRNRHDRSWWRSRYSRIALFAGGYYYWNSGYWYPAYGYDPYYSTYTYDEPIYGYNDLEPGQVIANVQQALQEQGYYQDAVDGLIGPQTRAALSDFQRDRGLPVTAAIDGPTLQALGLY